MLAEKLNLQGYEVRIAEAPWQLCNTDAMLATMLMEDWVTAAKQRGPGAADQLDAWFAVRKQQLDAGELKITVCHQDVLGLPVA